jgi:hypothetical protein
MMTGSAETVAGFPAQGFGQGVRQGFGQGVRLGVQQASGSGPIFMINLSEAASSPNRNDAASTPYDWAGPAPTVVRRTHNRP